MKKFSLLRALVACLIVTAVPLAASAQQGDPVAEEPLPTRYETVVRGDAVDPKRPADDPAGFSTVLTIKQPPAGTKLSSVLERVPGLRVKDSGPGGRRSLTLRGTGGHQSVVLLDGIRLTSAGSVGGTDLSLLDPAHLSRVEVRRGGSSARFGSDAVGGVLLLSTAKLRSGSRHRASLSYGSQQSMAARVSSSGSVNESVRYLASGSFHRTAGDFAYEHPINGTAHVRDNNDSMAGELLLKGDVLVSDRFRVALLNDFSLGERGAPGIMDATCATSRQQDLRNLTALSATRYDLLFSGVKLDVSLHHRFGRFRYHSSCGVSESHTHNHDLGASARLVLPLGERGRLDLGLELGHEWLLDQLDGQSRMLESTIRRLSGAVFASASLRFFDGQLVLVPALRSAGASGHSAVLVPKLGLVVHPLNWTEVWWLSALSLAGNIGRNYRFPSFFELYIDMDGVQSNPFLRAEDSIDGDVGLRWEHRVLALEVAYFQRSISDLILFVPVWALTAGPRNFDGALSRGAEGALRLRPGLGLNLSVAYTYTRSTWGDPEIELPGHPDHRLVTRLGWSWPFASRRRSAWAVGLWSGVTYESGMVLDLHNSIQVGPRVLLSAGATARWRWFSLSAEGRNLLDQRHLLDSLGFPLPPARFWLSLSAAI